MKTGLALLIIALILVVFAPRTADPPARTIYFNGTNGCVWNSQTGYDPKCYQP